MKDKSESKKTISILGCGWLGEPLALELIKKGYKVKGSSRNQEKIEKLEAAGIQMFHIDTENPEGMDNEFFRSDVLVLNITSKVYSEYQTLAKHITGEGTGKVLFISSTSVYPSLNITATEETPPEPTPLYNIETLFREHSDFLCTVVRFGGLFGPGRPPGRFFSRRGIIPDPTHPVNLIHLDDCLKILTGIIEKEHWGVLLNGVCDDHPPKGEYYISEAKKGGFEVPEIGEMTGKGYKVVSGIKAAVMLGFNYRKLI